MATAVIDESPTASTSDRSTEGPQAPAIRPRRSLPNGRAVAGALLVSIAAVGAFTVARGGESPPDTSYLVSARPVDAGEVLSDSDLEVVPIELPSGVAAIASDATLDVQSAVALRDLRSGELLSPDDLLLSPDPDLRHLTGTHEVTLPISRDRAGPSLVPGDRVTILTTLSRTQPATTVVATEDAVVVDWNTGTDGIGATRTGVITLALTSPAAVLELAHLATLGEITVVRTTRAISDPYPDSYPAPGTARDDWQEPIEESPGTATP